MTTKVEYWDGSSWVEMDFRSAKRDRRPMSFDEFEVQTSKKYLGEIGRGTDIKFMLHDDWVFAGKVKDGGELNQRGILTLQALSYGAKQLRTDVSISKDDNATNGSVMQSLVEDNVQYRDSDGDMQDYSLSYPSDETFDIPNYSFQGKAKEAKNELERKIKWTLWFEPGGDAYYQPVGYGDTGKSIDTSEDNASVKKYKPGDDSTVVSKVRVVGVDEDGDKVVYESSLSDADAENFEQVRVGFDITEGEAERIAEQYLEGSATDEVKIFVPFADFGGDNFNKSIGFSDEVRTDGEEESFFVQEEEVTTGGQVKLVLEKAMRWDLSDEQVRDRRELGSERSQLIETSEEGNDLSAGEDKADVSRDTDVEISTDDNFSGVNKKGSVNEVVTEQGYYAGVYSDDITSDLDGEWHDVSNDFSAGSKYYLFHAAWANFNITTSLDFTGTVFIDVFIRIHNTSKGEYFPDSSGVKLLDQIEISEDEAKNISVNAYLHAPFNWFGDDYRLEYSVDVDESYINFLSLYYSYHGSEGHVHNEDIRVEDDVGNSDPSFVKSTSGSVDTQPDFSDNGHSGHDIIGDILESGLFKTDR